MSKPGSQPEPEPSTPPEPEPSTPPEPEPATPPESEPATPPEPESEAAPVEPASQPDARKVEPGTHQGGHWANEFGLTLEEPPPSPRRPRPWMILAGLLGCAVLAAALLLVAVAWQAKPSGAPCRISARLAGDVTVPDGTAVAAGNAFVKTWRLQNDGTCPWEQGSQLAYASGDPLGGPTAVNVASLAVGSGLDVSVNFVAPVQAGSYKAIWRLQTASGIPFGPELHVQIVVPAGAGSPEPTTGPAETPAATPSPSPAETPTATPTPGPTPTPTPTPSPSPFGGGLGLIAFVSFRDGNAEIYSTGPDDAAATRLTNNAAIDDHPKWSFDGAKIAFERWLSGKPDIFVMNANGSGQTNLTGNPAYDTAPSWSPDGSKIAFASDRAGGRLQIFVMNADGSGVTQVTSAAGISTNPAWSPDGSYIAFEATRDGTREIYVMKPDGSAQTRLTFSDQNYGPSWSPNGVKIVWSRGDGIYAMNANGSGVTQLTHDIGPLVLDAHPAYSPNGALIVFDTARSGNSDLWTMKPDGTALTQLTHSTAADLNPCWR
jgi:Tol biopolymer transport system component